MGRLRWRVFWTMWLQNGAVRVRRWIEASRICECLRQESEAAARKYCGALQTRQTPELIGLRRAS